MCRIKLTLEGIEEEEEEEEQELSHTSWHKMTPTMEISLITANDYKSRHSQPECGYALEPSRWTEYSIHTMDPDNLELVFEFFEVILLLLTVWRRGGKGSKCAIAWMLTRQNPISLYSAP